MTLATLESLSVAPERCRAQAWAGSTLVHGLFIGLAILLITDLQPTTQSEPLKLDIAFIQPAPSEILERVEPQELPKPMPVTKKIVQEKVVPPTPVQQPIIEEKPVIEERRDSPTMKTHDVHFSEPVPIPRHQRLQDPVPVKPVLESTPIEQDVVSEPVKAIFAQTAHSKLIERYKTVEDVRPMEQETLVEQVKPIKQQETILPQKTVMSPGSVRTPVTQVPEMVEIPTRTTQMPEPLTETVRRESVPVIRSGASVRPQLIQRREEVVEPTTPVVEEEPIVRERPFPQIHQRTAVVHRTIKSYPETEADYGWLAKTIWSQIEKYKRYPTKARQKEWEGKVVLEAVIRRDGTILNLRVSETSGHEILDQDALNLLWKLSPLTLDHALGRSQITILVPLTYQLDG